MIAETGKKGLKRSAKQKVSAEPIRKLKVWVLIPHLETTDPNLEYYYDFSQSLEEYKRAFSILGADWVWQPVTVKNYAEIISGIRKRSGRKVPVVLNLCDGDEINGTPGVSVIGELEKHRLIYTGASDYFYRVTTSKIPMKEAFDTAAVPSSPWKVLRSTEDLYAGLCQELGAPVIIKPAVSGGSMGVSVRNVVYTDAEMEERVREIEAGYRGWNLLVDGLIAESFIVGREFTTFVVGSGDTIRCYPAVERIFHESLPDEEKFLSFDRLWEIYEDEQPMPGNANFYEYQSVSKELDKKLSEVSVAAYSSVEGVGYGRLDIRMDSNTGKLFVLEVNAQCGLSEDENYTSIGAILRFAGVSFAEVVKLIIDDAFSRRGLSY
ncbi:MAG: hypothetical protein KA821_00430 [Chitinophagaceae bacterium]|nr:hypothetical protein [Chitinophagaceae bacterium]